MRIEKEPISEVLLVLQDSISRESEPSISLHEANIPLTKYTGIYILYIYINYNNIMY